MAVATVLGLVPPLARPDSVGPVAAAVELEEVTVYARRLTPVARVAATVTVIDSQEMAASLVADVKQMVRYEPGLTVGNDPFRFGLDSFAIRGLGGNRVAVEVDQIPAASGFAVGSYSNAGRRFVDLAFVDRVELLRGPASSLYGSDAIGGIVSMRTLRPASLLGGADGYAVRTEAGYASADDGWHAALIGATQAGPGELLAGYVRREGQELDTAADVKPDPRDYTADSALLKYEFTGLGSGPLTLTAEGSQVRQDSSVDAFLGLPGRFVNTTELTGHDEVRRYRLSVDQNLGATAAFDTLDWRAYWQGTDTQQVTFELRKAVPPRTPPLQIDRSFDYNDHMFGADATAVKALAAGSTTHEVVYGFEAAQTRIEERRNGLQTNLTNGSTTVTILGETLPVRDLPITDVTEVGVFAQDEIAASGARWTLVPALRLDYYRLDPKADAIYRADNPHSTAVGLDDYAFAPKLGATWQFSDALHGFLQYAHGFRAPPPEDVNIGLELPLFNIRAVPNPELKSERSDGYEAGLRWQSQAVQATTSVYYNSYRDFIESKVNLGPDPVTHVTLFQSQNVAEARIYGAELSLAVQAESWSPRLAGWSGHLSAAWSRGDDLTRHEPLNSVQPSTAVAGLRYDSPARRWGSELVVTAVDAKQRVDDSRVDLYETDGYVTVDWLLQFNLGHGLALNAGLFNLGNASYIEWADVQGRAANDPLLPYYTRPGRHASVTLHWQF